jgi:hypothetical protein
VKGRKITTKAGGYDENFWALCAREETAETQRRVVFPVKANPPLDRLGRGSVDPGLRRDDGFFLRVLREFWRVAG